MVRVHLMGRVAVTVAGGAAVLPAGRPAELLAWLAAHPGLHPRNRVAPLFWPDVADATSRSSLRTALWSLRRALGSAGGTALVVERDRIGLGDAPDVWVDLREALDHLYAPDEAVATAAAADLADADLVPGIEAEWADQLRERVREAVVTRLAALAATAEDRGDPKVAVRVTRMMAGLDPLSEDVHRLLVNRLAAADDRAAALSEHAEFKRRLWDELGVVPSAATRQLVQAVAAAPVADGTDRERPLPSRLARADRAPFVARTAELAMLEGAWRKAVEARAPHLVLIGGPPGIGKTRLAARFASDVHERGHTVLFGSAAEDALVPAEPFLEALGEVHVRDPAELINAVIERVRASTAAGPTLLVLDDLHWAESVTLAVLRRLVRLDAPVVMVVTHRPTESGSKIASLAADTNRECDVTQIELGGLSRRDTAALLESIADGDALAGRADRIHHQTGGNPYFASELARFLLEVGSDVLESAHAVPQSIRNLVASRLARLSARARDLVAAVAVLTYNADLTVLQKMNVAGDDLQAIEEATGSGLIEEHAGEQFEFPHAIVREAVYNDLSLSRRTRLHGSAAAALRDRWGDGDGPHLCDIALHECAAPASGVDPIGAARRAAAWAVENHRYDVAVVVLTRALPLADETARRDLAIRRAIAYQRLSHAVYDVAPT